MSPGPGGSPWGWWAEGRAEGRAEALTSCCEGGSRRRRCSSSGRSGCSAGTGAEGRGRLDGRRPEPLLPPRLHVPVRPTRLPVPRPPHPTSGPPLRLSLTPRREISRSQEAGGRRWTVSFRAVAIWGRSQRRRGPRGLPSLEHLRSGCRFSGLILEHVGQGPGRFCLGTARHLSALSLPGLPSCPAARTTPSLPVSAA